MLGVGEDLFDGTSFHDVPSIHHGHVIADVHDHT
jgi:hypothetical protein